jgi:hypothetical protein
MIWAPLRASRRRRRALHRKRRRGRRPRRKPERKLPWVPFSLANRYRYPQLYICYYTYIYISDIITFKYTDLPLGFRFTFHFFCMAENRSPCGLYNKGARVFRNFLCFPVLENPETLEPYSDTPLNLVRQMVSKP